MNLTNFGQQFASKVLGRTYQNAVFQAITNSDYQGEIKNAGDRVNILSFLNAGELGDYVVGTNMTVGQIVDANDQLVVEKRKYYSFSLDRLEDLFTYADDIPSSMVLEHSKVLERTTDAYVLNKFGEETKAGNWVGMNFLVLGDIHTGASLVTTATGGTITVIFDQTNPTDPTNVTSVENPLDGVLYNGGFQTTDLYKGIRLLSTRAFVTPWYRISGITNSVSVTVTEWDEETNGPDFEENYTLRGLFGGDGVNFPKYGPTGDCSFVDWGATDGAVGLGWEVQAAIATAITAASVYDQITLLAQKLDENEVSPEDRHITVPPSITTQLRQAAELQPTGIAEIYTGTVLNGRVMRIGAFDVHQAAGARLSTRSGRSTSAGVFATAVLAPGATGYLIPANHIGCMTFADKWSESRVVDSEDQFAKKYQGLFLFGAKVPAYRRKYAAILFGSV
jgi:hypothetical protein